MFIEAKDDGSGGDNWTTGAIIRAKLQSTHHHQQTNMHFFTGQMALLSPNEQCQSTEGKNITFHELAYPKLTWGSSNFCPSSKLPILYYTIPYFQLLSLTTNGSWLPWGSVAMPLISPLMPVAQSRAQPPGDKQFLTSAGNCISFNTNIPTHTSDKCNKCCP